MNFKRFHESKNLFDGTLLGGYYTGANYNLSGDGSIYKSIKVYLTAGTYTFSWDKNVNVFRIIIDGNYSQTGDVNITSYTITTTIDGYVGISFRDSTSSSTPWDENSPIMLNTGSTPQPYEPHSSEVWHDIPHYIHNTSTDTLTTLPADIYANDTTATVGLKGQTVQSGTPAPQNPVMPEGCGDLETSGAKAGQYKIPISSANTTTPVYLGEVETTRQIQKLVLTGNEGFARASGGYYLGTIVPDYARAQERNLALCSHYPTYKQTNVITNVPDKHVSFAYGTTQRLYLQDSDFANATELNAYLQQQYAAGTPVTVWYVLATEETAVVNEPLQKIGDYADTVSGISIPTTTGNDSFDVLTTLKPSEVSLAYTGWHDASVKEWDGSEWQ